MSGTPINAVIVGAGNIAGRYAQDMMRYPEINLLGVTDLDHEKAQALAAAHGVKLYPSLDDALADEAVELIVNLTTHHAHKDVVTRCLQAGRHVHSEKPLALTTEEAWALVRLAAEKGVRLGCSPVTLMGEAQQTAWKIIRAGQLGTVRVAYAEVNWGRIEAWHPAPEPFYAVGALFDVGVYPLTILTAMFGPARRVAAYSKMLYPDRVTKEGRPFHIETPDFVLALLELESGLLVRLTTNFYVSNRYRQTGIEFHGDLGSLHLANWQEFDAAVAFARYDEAYQPVAPVREAFNGTEWGRGILDMARAIREDRPHRATGEHAAHVVEILCAITESIRSRSEVTIKTSFTPPAPMVWAT